MKWRPGPSGKPIVCGGKPSTGCCGDCCCVYLEWQSEWYHRTANIPAGCGPYSNSGSVRACLRSADPSSLVRIRFGHYESIFAVCLGGQAYLTTEGNTLASCVDDEAGCSIASERITPGAVGQPNPYIGEIILSRISPTPTGWKLLAQTATEVDSDTAEAADCAAALSISGHYEDEVFGAGNLRYWDFTATAVVCATATCTCEEDGAPCDCI